MRWNSYVSTILVITLGITCAVKLVRSFSLVIAFIVFALGAATIGEYVRYLPCKSATLYVAGGITFVVVFVRCLSRVSTIIIAVHITNICKEVRLNSYMTATSDITIGIALIIVNVLNFTDLLTKVTLRIAVVIILVLDSTNKSAADNVTLIIAFIVKFMLGYTNKSAFCGITLRIASMIESMLNLADISAAHGITLRIAHESIHVLSHTREFTAFVITVGITGMVEHMRRNSHISAALSIANSVAIILVNVINLTNCFAKTVVALFVTYVTVYMNDFTLLTAFIAIGIANVRIYVIGNGTGITAALGITFRIAIIVKYMACLTNVSASLYVTIGIAGMIILMLNSSY